MNDGGPAFPRAAFAPTNVGYEDCGIHDSQEGMSLRDYFAVHAPLEVPDWFLHAPPPNDFPAMPRWADAPERYHKLLQDWLDDGCFDLPDELAWFQVAVKKHHEGKAAWSLKNAEVRFIQWRWYYADAMIAASFERSSFERRPVAAEASGQATGEPK